MLTCSVLRWLSTRRANLCCRSAERSSGEPTSSPPVTDRGPPCGRNKALLANGVNELFSAQMEWPRQRKCMQSAPWKRSGRQREENKLLRTHGSRTIAGQAKVNGLGAVV